MLQLAAIMKISLTITTFFIIAICAGQVKSTKPPDLAINLDYKPVTISLISDSLVRETILVGNVGKISYKDLKNGFYKIYQSGPGKPLQLIDSILISEEKLVINIKQIGPCLYDHPKDYIPTCPKNHTDSIIPIVYGLIAERGNMYIKNKTEEKVRYAGCVVTDCDPRFYCKMHSISF